MLISHVFLSVTQKIRVSSNGNGNDARIVYERLRLSCLIPVNVTVTQRPNGLRSRNPNPGFWSIFIVRG